MYTGVGEIHLCIGPKEIPDHRAVVESAFIPVIDPYGIACIPTKRERIGRPDAEGSGQGKELYTGQVRTPIEVIGKTIDESGHHTRVHDLSEGVHIAHIHCGRQDHGVLKIIKRKTPLYAYLDPFLCEDIGSKKNSHQY